MILRDTAGNRAGLTLLEVLVALTIFLLSLGAISQLVTFASQRAQDARHTDDAARLARSKLAEVFAGVVTLSSQSETPFDDDPDYLWSMTANSGTLSGLWDVEITVKHKDDKGPGFTLQQFILDPTLRGSTQDTVFITGTMSTSSGSGKSSSSAAQGAAGASAAGGGSATSGASSGSGRSGAASSSGSGRSGSGSTGNGSRSSSSSAGGK